MNKNLVRKTSAIALLIVLQYACGASSTPISEQADEVVVESTSTRIPFTPTAKPTNTATATIVPTPTLNFEIPAPISGKGTLIGNIQWNSLPSAKAQVKLCSDFTIFYGCKGLEYSALTDEQGYYLIENIKPDEYTLLANLFGTSWYLYALEPIKIKADETKFADVFHLYKLDLKAISPTDEKNIDVTKDTPILEWEAYPDTASYEVEVDIYFQNAILIKTVEENKLSLKDEILITDCSYNWTVSAYNKDGNKISELKKQSKFNIINSGTSCYLTNILPANGTKFTQGSDAQLSWGSHPLADYYIVRIVTQDDWIKLYTDENGAKVEKNTLIFDVSDLSSGSYTWLVEAFNASGEQIATSESLDFIISAP